MDPSKLNFLAIFVAALSTFLLGGIWYSKAIFGKAWARENGLTDEDLKKGNMVKIFGVSFILALIGSVNLAMFLGPTADVSFGAFAGLAAGAGWVATQVGTHYLFEHKSLTLFLINAGYSTVSLTIMGAILGAWH
jgi:Protein of unknown function (DUF1761)